jgi:hypothetical protein
VDAVLPRLHALVAENATGVVWIRDADPAVPSAWVGRVELFAGWVHAFSAIDAPAGEDELRAAARRRPSDDPLAAFRRLIHDAARRGAIVQRSDDPRARIGAITPFHPTRELRRVAETVLEDLRGPDHSYADLGEPGRILGTASLSLRAPLHASALDPDEQRLAALLVRGATLEALVSRAGCPPARTHAFVRQLLLLGALLADGAAIHFDLPGTVERARAAAAARRRSYHAEARKVHPDLHPDADASTRTKLTDEMAELAARQKKR